MKHITEFVVSILLAVLVNGCGNGGDSDFMVTDLRCEYRENPVIDTVTPRLSWKILSGRRGVTQMAYRILVAEDAKNLSEDTGDLWDSGWIDSGQSVNVEYQGMPLEARMECRWKVNIRDNSGAESGWSESARFEIAFTGTDDWQASWIYDGKPNPIKDEDFFRDDPAPLFRKAFTAQKQIERARLYITGLGYYEAYINGRRVGDHVLDPGWTTYSKRILYSVCDVTDMLGRGDNAVDVILGNGWYNPVPMRMWSRLNLREHLTVGRPRFIAQLEIEYTDASRETIVTDESWKVAEGPILRNNIFLGEEYDARREIPGWNSVDFDDSGWKEAHIAEAPSGELRVQSQPPIRITDTFEYLHYTQPAPDVYIFDMGRNFAGWAGLKVKGPAGTKIVMRYGELLNPDGTLNVMTSTAGQIKPGARNQPEGVPVPACQSDTYILKGEESELYVPRFTFHGFRYVEVTGHEGESTIDGIAGFRLNADVGDCGTFECSNPLFNSIQDMTRRTFLSNLFSVQSDCPHRERFGYGGDIVPTSEAFMFNYDMSTMYPKIVRDFEDAARDNNGLTETAPFVGIDSEGFGGGTGPIGWTLAHPYLLDRLYRFYGNERLMREQYDVLKRHVEFTRSSAPDHVIDHGIGDHESIDPKDEALTGTAFYLHQVRILAWLAKTLGYDSDFREYDRLSRDIESAFVKRFHAGDGDIGVYGNGTQSTQATTLYYGLASQDNEAAFRRLVDEIERHDRHLSTGIFGTKFMLDVLSRPGGRPDLAFDIVNQRTFPGWGYMLENGATTLWEHLPFSDNVYSHNHPMFGSVSEWFYRTVAGINPAPDAVGFDKIVIRPQPVGDLKWAKGSHESIRGLIASDWKIENGMFRLTVTIPANTTAEVHVPTGDPDSVTEGGVKANTADGVKFLRFDNGYAVYAVGSGTYNFSSIFRKTK